MRVVVVVVGLRFQKGSKWFVEVAPVAVVCFQTSLQRIVVDYCRTSLRRCVEVMSRVRSWKVLAWRSSCRELRGSRVGANHLRRSAINMHEFERQFRNHSTQLRRWSQLHLPLISWHVFPTQWQLQMATAINIAFKTMVNGEQMRPNYATHAVPGSWEKRKQLNREHADTAFWS